MQAATIIPSSHQLDLPSPTPLVILALGAAVAERLDPGAFSPDHVSLDIHGDVAVGRALPGLRWWAPERRGAGAADVDPDSPAAALWTLGRFLLELALGRRLETPIVDAFNPGTAWIDVDGRALPGRLLDVIGALLVFDPAQRLQSTRAAARVCAEAAARFGDVDSALRVAARRRFMRVTADLPARDILSPGELQQLKQQTSIAGLDVIRPAGRALARSTSSIPLAALQADAANDAHVARQLAAAMPAATDASGDDHTDAHTDDGIDDAALGTGLDRRQWLAVGAVAAVIVLAVSAWSLT